LIDFLQIGQGLAPADTRNIFTQKQAKTSGKLARLF
jgi:hypothetical protein